MYFKKRENKTETKFVTHINKGLLFKIHKDFLQRRDK